MRVSIWSPLPPSPSGIADYVAETLPDLQAGAQVEVVCEDPGAVDPELRARVAVRSPSEGTADLDVYHVGNSPSHAYVYRAAVRHPGVAVLHDWNLHHLLLGETVERGDPTPYLREMRRTYGADGSLIGRQVARALGGDMLPALYPLNERVLESSLGVVALSRRVAEQAARRLPDRPVLHLPHHIALPLAPLPTRMEARRALGLPEEALIVTAPGLATAPKRLDAALRVIARLRPRFPGLQLVVAGGVDSQLPLQRWAEEAAVASVVTVTGRLSLDDFLRHLIAADLVLALRFPSYGEMSGALVRAMGVGRPALVTAGTPSADEMPPGTVVPVDAGPHEEAELLALLTRLLADAGLRERIGTLAREHVRQHHDLSRTVRALLAFLDEVRARKAELLAAIAQDRAIPGTLLGYLKEEVRWGARDLGLSGVHLGLDDLLMELAGATIAEGKDGPQSGGL
jgi:glycosyltransferase involved in cell wall biosynthesis